jgi:fumarylacetoacetate (FAA) hydrolase family protein
MSARIHERLTVAASLPDDAGDALLVGRVFVPAVGGPVLVRVVGDDLLDLSTIASISSELLDRAEAIDAIRRTRLPRLGSLAAALANAAPAGRDTAAPWLLAPCDLQAIKAAGVTFVASMLERVIEDVLRSYVPH